MDKFKIAFFDTKEYDEEYFNEHNKKYGFKIKYFENKLNEDTVSLTKGYDAVCVFVNDDLNAEVISKLKTYGIKLIALRCAGFNNVDLKSIDEDIMVVRVPAYSPYAVAEHAISLILTLNRKTHKAYNRTREHNFAIKGLQGFDINNKVAGVIGTGKIGKIVIKILQGFGMNVLAYDLYPDYDYAKEHNFKYVDLDELYENSDIISLHCPLTNETYNIINKMSISKMKDGVMIINTSRGQLIDTRELIEGLTSGKIGYAGLDVYEEESEYFFEDNSTQIVTDDILVRLLSFHNVLITSHQAFFTKEALNNIAEITLENIKRFVLKEDLENIVK